MSMSSSSTEEEGLADDEELVAGSPQERNWRGIGIALLVIMSLCAFIAACVLLFTPGFGTGDKDNRATITLEDIRSIRGSRVPRTSWSPTGDTLVAEDSRNGSLIVYDLSGETTRPQMLVTPIGMLLDMRRENGLMEDKMWADKLKKLRENGTYTPTFFVSTNRKYLTKGTKVARNLYDFRHSSSWTLALFKIMADGTTKEEEPIGPLKTGDEPVRLFKWTPAQTALDFIFVHDNNLYYQAAPQQTAVAITNTKSNFIFNGVADWLYEEEILGASEAVWWSLTGNKIAYATFDDTNVNKMTYPEYSKDKPYPEQVVIPYTKVGYRLPTVTLWIWDKHTQKSTKMSLPSEVTETGDEYYLFSASWLPNEILLATWATRDQTITYTTYCTTGRGSCVLNKRQEYKMMGMSLWAEPEQYRMERSVGDANGYFVLLPRELDYTKEGDEEEEVSDVFTNIARVTNEGHTEFIHSDAYDVKQIIGFDKLRNLVYYTAPAPEPWFQYVFVTSAANRTSAGTCVTCWLGGPSHNCTVQQPQMSRNAQWMLVQCQGFAQAQTLLMRASTDEDLMRESMIVLEGGKLQREVWIDKFPQPEVVYRRYSIVDEETGERSESLVKLLFPPGAQHDYESYPLLVHVYGGPNSPQVRDNAIAATDMYFATNKKTRYIVAYIDGRGSGRRGWRQKASMYRNLGTVEVVDQIETAKMIVDEFKQINSKQVAVWGWSYGGFVTAHIIKASGREPFRCAASVAPVTNFKFYDAAYTERYMGLLKDNQLGYNRTSLMENLSKFREVEYLLMHGTGDDNVHFMNSANFVSALTHEGVQFDFMMYPNEQHGIGGSSQHLNAKLDNFLRDCFEGALRKDEL